MSFNGMWEQLEKQFNVIFNYAVITKRSKEEDLDWFATGCTREPVGILGTLRLFANHDDLALYRLIGGLD
jgi:hypothetical protein